VTSPVASGGSAKSKTPFSALLSADGVSEVGNEFAALALPWLVLETTGSAARAGLLVAAGTATASSSGWSRASRSAT
jgi:hypothetical protein